MPARRFLVAHSGVIFEVADMRLLLIEDDRKVASFLVKGLTESGYAVEIRCTEAVRR